MLHIRHVGLALKSIPTSPMKWSSLVSPVISAVTSPTRSRFLGCGFGNSRNFHKTAGLCKKDIANIEFSVVPRDQTRHVNKFLEKFYQKEEPVTKGFQMPMSELHTDQWFHSHIQNVFDVSVTPSTVEAVDKTTGETVGIFLGCVIDPEVKCPEEITSFFDPKQCPVNHAMYEYVDVLLDGVDAAHCRVRGKDGKRVRVNDILYMSTDPDYAGLGIQTRLADMNEAIAKSCNCGISFVITTSEFTYQVFKSRGYEIGREIKYAEYTDKQGNKPFTPMLEKLKPHHAGRAMVKKMKPIL